LRSPTYLNESNRPSKISAEPANGHLRPDTSLDTGMGHGVPTFQSFPLFWLELGEKSGKTIMKGDVSGISC
jgi:hypothetical protein